MMPVSARTNSLLRNFRILSERHETIYILGVLLAYFAIAFSLYAVIDLFASNARQPTRDSHYLATVATAFRQLAVTVGLEVSISAWVASAAHPADRRLVLWRTFWYFGPITIFAGLLWMLRLGFWAISTLEFLLLTVPTLMVGILSIQVTSPILRSWMYRRAVDSARIQIAEKRLHWPLRKSEWQEYEIIIPANTYFGLLAGIFTILFIVIETTLGELLTGQLTNSGYIGASIIALFVGAIIYPIHNWTSRQFVIGESSDKGDVSDEQLSQQFVSKTKAYYRIIFVDYWYLAVLAVILAIFLQMGVTKYFPLY